MYLLDTCVILELRKPKPAAAIVAWLKSVPDEELFISALTIGELQAGVERIRTQDRRKSVAMDRWIDRMAEVYEIIPMDAAIFREWARLLEGKPEQQFEDAMIAATARVRRLLVVTRNVQEFAALGVRILNPFEVSENPSR